MCGVIGKSGGRAAVQVVENSSRCRASTRQCVSRNGSSMATAGGSMAGGGTVWGGCRREMAVGKSMAAEVSVLGVREEGGDVMSGESIGERAVWANTLGWGLPAPFFC